MEGLIVTSWPEFAGAALILAVAQAIYVLLGFGAGLVAVGTLALFVPGITDVVVVLTLVSLPAELFVVARSWKSVSWRGTAVLCATLAVGVLLGTRALVLAEPRGVATLLGAFLVAIGAAFLWLRTPRVMKWPAWSQPVVGLLSGLLAGLLGMGAPPLVLYYQTSGIPKAKFRAHLMTIFLFTAAVRLPTYVASGLLTAPRLMSAAVLLPAALLGGFVGHRIHFELSETFFRKLVSIALCVIGVLLLFR